MVNATPAQYAVLPQTNADCTVRACVRIYSSAVKQATAQDVIDAYGVHQTTREEGTTTVQTTFSFGFDNGTSDTSAHMRKLTLKKETLRQLTGGELRMVAGGGASAVSLSPSTKQSGTSVISSGTSVILPSTSASISGH